MAKEEAGHVLQSGSDAKLKKKSLHKKAAIEIPVNTVIIIIIAILFLSLALFFAKSLFGKSTTKLEEQIISYSKPPTVIISSPSDNSEYFVKEDILFDASGSYDAVYKIKAYYWDFEGDGKIDSEEKTAHHSYLEPGRYNIAFKAVNEDGAIGTATVTVIVISENRKDMAKYQNSPLFMVSDKDYKAVLRLIPVVTWKGKGELKKYPYSVYYGSIDSSTAIKIMGANNADYSVIFDQSIQDNPEAGIDSDSMDNYFDYWQDYESVVLVDPGNDEAALISALFAGFINSPLIFVDGGNIAAYKSKIEGKKVYIIDGLDPAVMPYISKNDRKEYTNDQISNPAINIFSSINSTALFVS